MKLPKKNMVLLGAIIGSLLVIYFSYGPISKESPYPSVKKQKKLLANKPLIKPYNFIDSNTVVSDLRFFSSEICEGRKSGTPGHDSAVNRIIIRFRQAGIDSLQPSYLQESKDNADNSRNIIGMVKGTSEPEKIIVISAHFDHLGKAENGNIFYGASDNASGTACLLSMASYFKKHPIRYSILFAAFDNEEIGLKGSDYFLTNLPPSISLSAIKFNLNIDMITREKNKELFVCGISHFPSLRYLVENTQSRTNTKVIMGHDTGKNNDDWTNKSDHYSFFIRGIQFLYLGTEDHEDLHKTTDTFDKIDTITFLENCNYCILIVESIKL